MTDFTSVQPLTEEQARAASPKEQVWLAASAGTGKTQVLSARVLRLLLNGARPETILCLTFTKGGATEMADRVNRHLAAWVRAPKTHIRADLFNLGESHDDARIAYARTLFARVLDARGGGLRIQTIHSFCQTLLAGFPAEAGLTPGFRPMEERETVLLAKTVLAELVQDAHDKGDEAFLDGLGALALQLGEKRAQDYLMQCARAGGALEALGSGMEAKVRLALKLPLGDVESLIATLCSDEGTDRQGLEEIARANAAWATDTGLKRADIIAGWLKCSPQSRAETLDELVQVWSKADGERRSIEAKLARQSDDYDALCARAYAYYRGLIDLRRLDVLAHQISAALTVGQHYARAFADAKRSGGWVDFEDLIHSTAHLLGRPGMGDWIRYKLDQETDHILVDEAQDTNDAQWEIIKALTSEFFAGAGAKPDTLRTIFTVGDAKQAIFGFQGTDPRAMRNARDWFETQAHGAEQILLNLNLALSYRSSPPILKLVDAVIAQVGSEHMGLGADEKDHRAARGVAGHVMLLPPVSFEGEDQEDTDESEYDEAGWLPPSSRLLAQQLAEKVAGWLKEGLWIEDRQGRNIKSRLLEPKDIMILLRSRSDLAQLIVARLHEAKVNVAGVDRLRLNTPLPVRDVLAAIRLVLQPHDDLNLACLLTSPLIGWSQDDLQHLAIGRGKLSLWEQLRASSQHETHDALTAMLNMGDRHSPARFIEALLSGPLRGRQKLLERFGSEALDPLNELMSAALAFERTEGPSLQAFLDWFERGEIDIKRDADSGENAVRVMTVHAAKGLQAPLVILADATNDPDKMRRQTLDWELQSGEEVPIPNPRKGQRVGAIAQLADDTSARELQEHYRLLYVALTRAEERLVIWGTQKGKALSEKSWYHQVGAALRGLGAQSDETGALEFGEGAKPLRSSGEGVNRDAEADAHPYTRPPWLDTPAPKEARPTRPLAPSALTEDTSANPPPSPALQAAAERGRLLHALFERLPDVLPEQRTQAADAWLAGAAGVPDAATRAALIADALGVIQDINFAAIFEPEALAEAPVAGVVDGVVIAGTVDRLLVKDGKVLIVDFKTARRVPRDVNAIPEAHLRQMAAYVAVLQGIFPDHDVKAALLYTTGPMLFTLDDDLMAAHKPSFALEQIVLSQQA